MALSQQSDDDTDDGVYPLLDSEDAEADKVVVDADPEQQRFYRTIHLPEVQGPRTGDGVGDYSVECSRFSIDDLIRPLHRLANLKAYGNGAVCQVVAIDDGRLGMGRLNDPIVSYFDDDGILLDECRLRVAEHFEKICTTAIFDEHPLMRRSVMLRNCGAMLAISAKYSRNSRPSASSEDSV